MTDTDFKKHNVRGAITYSQFTMAQALANNERSQFKKTDDEVAPVVQLLLDQVQLDKLVTHLKDVYLPEALARAGKEKRDAFEKKIADRISKALDEGQAAGWENTPPYLPIKPVYYKTQDVAPWAVGTLRITGSKGRDFTQLARVTSDAELKTPAAHPDYAGGPALFPIEQTTHELYPGAWAYATLNLSGYFQSTGNFGISAYANDIVFIEDRDRLAGGVSLDQDDVFMDE